MPAVKADAGEETERALRAALAGFGGAVAVERIQSWPWASLAFSGARHVLLLTLDGESAGAQADAFLAGLSEREFALCGHLLADIAPLSEERDPAGRVRLLLEALTVEES